MNAQRSRRRPSGPLIISLVALFVALGGTSHAASLAYIILGHTNAASRLTTIRARLTTPVLAVTNTGRGTAANFAAASDAPPFTVDSTTQVANLNASLLDGDSSSSFWSLDGNAKVGAKAYLGTSDNEPTYLGAGGVQYMAVYPSGTVGVGATGGNDSSSNLDVASINPNYEDAIHASSGGGVGVAGVSKSSDGVSGTSTSATGVEGQSTGGIGVLGNSNVRGVVGTLGGSSCPAPGTTSNVVIAYGVGGCGGTLGLGVFGRSTGDGGVVGLYEGTTCGGSSNLPTCGAGCTGQAGVVGCAGSDGDGVVGEISQPAGATPSKAAVAAVNTSGGNLFLGISRGTRVARIDGSGKAYFDGGTQSSGADYADAFRVGGATRLRPGDVLTIDRRGGVELARSPDSPLVAGVYSTKPAMLGVGDQPAGSSLADEAPVALVGVVPTRVCAVNGPVRVGDLLTTSSIPGCAMLARPVVVDGVPIYRTGTILGKALQPLPSGKGLIEVLVTLR
jgi:hypothetical protein